MENLNIFLFFVPESKLYTYLIALHIQKKKQEQIVISNILANVIVYIIFIDIIIIITLICSMPKSFFWKPFVHIFGEGRNMEQEQRPLSKPRRRPGFHRDRRWTEFYQERDSEVQWYILSYWLRKKSWQLDLGEWKTTKFPAMDKKLV